MIKKRSFRELINSTQIDEKKFIKAGNFIKEGKFEKGLEIIENLYHKYPENYLYNIKLASIYLDLKRSEEAKKIYLNLLNKNKVDINLCINLSSIFISENNARKAIEICKYGIEIEPNSRLIKQNLTIAYLINKEYKKADLIIGKIKNLEEKELNIIIIKCIIFLKLNKEKECYSLINSLSNKSFYDKFILNFLGRSIYFEEVDFAVNFLRNSKDKNINPHI